MMNEIEDLSIINESLQQKEDSANTTIKQSDLFDQNEHDFDHSSIKQESNQTMIEIDTDLLPPTLLKKINKNVLSTSFLLSIFDNIVGPRCIHQWKIKYKNADNQLNQDFFTNDLMKYVAIHTLNGELYQGKLFNQLKFRLYLISEVECAIFAVFFDASTFQSTSFSNNSESANYNNSDSNSSSGGGQDKAQTSLNCLSIIVPLDQKDILLKYYGDNTKFFINFFENMIIEFKINAHIQPKANQITKAIEFLTKSIRNFCQMSIVLENKDLMSQNEDLESQENVKITVNK
jgi:hypothetical protein